MTKVAFVSFRLKAQDGVSVESEKWISIFRQWGFEVCRVAGFIPEPGSHDYVIPEMNHQDPLVESFTQKTFSPGINRHELHIELAELSSSIERGLLPALVEISPDMIVAENVFSIPLNIPLTMVLSRFLAENGTPCIAVHHDFHWEHHRFRRCAMNELLPSHFPAPLPQIRHVTINNQAREELLMRTGINATCIRNCFDFSSPRQKDEFNSGFREELGLVDQDVFFLQPTRAIERKGISRSIRFVEEFAAASGRRSTLLITGSAEDGYRDTLERLSRDSEAEIIHKPGWLGYRRNCPHADSKYEVRDAYAHCDMVTFPSEWEGFGNPVLESVVHHKPVLVAHYPVLEELRAFGFQFLSLDDRAVSRAMKLMEHPQLMEEMADRNYEIGKRYFSLDNLKNELAELVSSVVYQ